jgi:hypothetical protein
MVTTASYGPADGSRRILTSTVVGPGEEERGMGARSRAKAVRWPPVGPFDAHQP